MMPIDLGQIIYPIIIILLIIGFIAFQLVYHFWYLPAISRAFAKAKHSDGLPAFIQDETKVKFCVSDKDYPEGLTHHKGKGWGFVNKKPDFDLQQSKERLKLRQTFITQKMEEEKYTDKEALEEWDKLGISVELTEEEKQTYKETEEKLLHTPILEGLGKPVFFGCIDSVALSNLKVISELSDNPQITSIEKDEKGIIQKVKTLAHANLRNCRLLAPIMYSKTQLAALEAQSVLEGQKMAGREVTKIVLIAIAVIGVVATVGIIAWLLTNSGG